MNGRMVLVLLVAVALTIGCIGERRLSPVVKAPLTDVPVPSPFTFDPKHSSDYTSQATGESIYNARYTGCAKFTDVVAFYNQQMPVEGWTPQQDVGTGDRRTLSFTKTGIDPGRRAASTCVVTIHAWGEYATVIQISRVER